MLSDDLVKRLDRCQPAAELPPEWLACTDEPCRRAVELPVLQDNATRHDRCVKLVDDVRREAEAAKLR